MATFEITAPNGNKYRVTGENAQGAHAALMKMLGNDAPAPAPAQPEISQGEDVKQALKSGLRTGAIAVPETLEMLGRFGVRTYQEAKDLLGYEVGDKTPVLQSTVGQALREAFPAEEYEPQTTAGEYAQTIAEFLPSAAIGGPAGIARRAVVAGVAGAGSEAAGQAAEKYAPSMELPARIIGAFAAPATGAKVANKTFMRSVERPTLDNLRLAKDAAYKAVDKAGVKFNQAEVNAIIAKTNAAAAKFNYVPEVDLQTTAALKTMQAQADQVLTVGQLDKLRQGLYRRYGAARNEQGIREMIDVIDEAILAKEPANKLMNTAREANKRYKKLELFEDAFKNAELSTAASGSGGNIVNNYRRAVANILKDKKKTKFFLDYEIKMMEQFVKGRFRDNTLRLMGKMAPTGGGLMQALNVGAIAYNPAMAGFTVAGTGAKALSDRGTMKQAEQILNTLSTGVAPKKKIYMKEIRTLLGLEAGENVNLLEPQEQ